MAIDWSGFVTLVRQHSRFLLTTHVRPDADGLGSKLALAEALQTLGKDVRMVIASSWPPLYRFLDPKEHIRRFKLPGDEYRDCDAIVVLDTGTWNQLGDFGTFMKSSSAVKAVIDHHISHDDLGAARFVDTSAEATGRLVHDAIGALGVPLTPNSANMLFSALATDTGWFRHSNTTPATFSLAEKLVTAGARPTWLYEQIYEQNTLPRLQLRGRALTRLQAVEGGKVAFLEVHLDDYEVTGAIPADTEDLINYPRSLTCVEVAMLFAEQQAGGVKVSFRSRGKVDVARLAESFDGGGHRLASGAIIQASLDEAKTRVLDAVRAALNR
ncbi:MAG: bifunctional oligoribonuclease/PAP phosphatase NrnA [Planctomycetes bacterium]|nr:bifunctional oligoribonuclease/PAP phosphatase NrnA [Planctomycetota bacterium]